MVNKRGRRFRITTFVWRDMDVPGNRVQVMDDLDHRGTDNLKLYSNGVSRDLPSLAERSA